ncbi:TRAP-type mannitol/chloroaromatic compound transport system, small permease component [Ruegeria denitrificans]|uniref:TRAP transporter small permease protein n=1 Tax=Ruegeria denitrificans TaxID=1715692 RepID=A0A0P1IJ84_9RHOB|nr:TRAP transporter small permease subunit [Ruegeria denitrificans]CUJ98792.1 TRAP-type mannitol/chloroaromatic compound transport system, small permease component [Ruegeria denitrificans]
MPGLGFTLPHWLYWVGLVVFPLVAMVLSRRPQPTEKRYTLPLAYMIAVTGGIIGLHRFYLKSMLGLVYLPIFLFVLYANGQTQDARNVLSDYVNQTRSADRTITREEDRVADARANLSDLQATVDAAEEGSFSQKSAERRLKRAEDTIEKGEARLQEARAVVEEVTPLQDEAERTFAFWGNAAGYAFYAILALILIDMLLLPGMIKRANAGLPAHVEKSDAEKALEEAEAEEGPKHDSEYATNWIDRLSLFCGEFVAYWAVIAVFVYYYEVIARYVFGSPTNWAHEAMYLMFGMQYLIAGAYAMLTESHVRVDIFYAPLSRPKKAWVDLLTSIFFFIFAGTLLVTSWIFAMDALAVPAGNSVVSDWARGQIGLGEMLTSLNAAQWTDTNIRWGEISFNEWEVPLWPMKWVMVMGGLLLVLQGISKMSKDIREIARGN